MTPDERTDVLKIVLQTRVGGVGGSFPIICPTSWLAKREALKANGALDWGRLSSEQRLLIWLEAPDSDYEYVSERVRPSNRFFWAAANKAKGTPP